MARARGIEFSIVSALDFAQSSYVLNGAWLASMTRHCEALDRESDSLMGILSLIESLLTRQYKVSTMTSVDRGTAMVRLTLLGVDYDPLFNIHCTLVDTIADPFANMWEVHRRLVSGRFEDAH